MKIYSVITILAAALLTGCAGHMKQLPNGDYLSATTVGDSLDRSATLVLIHEKVGENEDGSPIFRDKGKGNLTVGSTVAGDTLKAAIPGAIIAGIQYKSVVRGSEIKTRALTCPEGTVNCHSTVVEGARAAAVSDATSSTNAVVDVVLGGGCLSANCAAAPID